jgi:RND family efflux transporter MFP subunit
MRFTRSGLQLILVATLMMTITPLQAQTANNKVAVSVMTIGQQQYAKQVIASGTVRPVSEQGLAFKVQGIVDKVLVKEGTLVKKGQLLAILALDEIDAQVDKAEVVLKDAKRQLKRINELKNQQLLSDEQGRQAQTAVQVAQTELTIAKFNRKYAVIEAPTDGRILTRHIEPHELVQVGQKAFVFADESQGWHVQLSIADVDVVKLQLGDEAQIKLDAYPDQVFTGKIREIAGRADALSQTFAVGVQLVNSPRLLSGLIAHTYINPSQTRALSAVPLTSLLEANDNQATVYVVDDSGQAKRRTVKIAYLQGSHAMVSSGLADPQTVVVEGGPYITEGSEINIVNRIATNSTL